MNVFQLQPRGHSSHVGLLVEVFYRYHELYGRWFRRQYGEQRATGDVVYVEVAPGVVLVVAAWMLDAARSLDYKITLKPTSCQILPSLLRWAMTTMNISLPETLKAFVDQQIDSRGFGTSSEYVRELIRKDQDRQTLRALLLAGAQSATQGAAGASYFAGLRASIAKKSA